MLGVYKRLLLFLFQLQMLQHLSGKYKKRKKERFASLQHCVLKKKSCHILKEVFFCLQWFNCEGGEPLGGRNIDLDIQLVFSLETLNYLLETKTFV